MIFSNGIKAVLTLGRRHVHVHVSGLARQEERGKTFTLGEDVNEVSPGTLKLLLKSVADWLEEIAPARKPVDVSWILSDPWVHQRIFQVDSLPSGHKATDALVQWRFGQELGQGAHDLRVAWQPRSQADSSSALYCTGLHMDWYESLCQPWLERHWPVTSIVTLLHRLEACSNTFALDESPFTVVLTEEYWLTWRAGPTTSPGVRCRWFAEDPESEALLRDIARAINEEGLGKVRVFGSDVAPNVSRQITSRFADTVAEGALTLSDLYRRSGSNVQVATPGKVTTEGGAA